MAKEEIMGKEGLSSLAHAIRRSTALYVAMQVTPPDSTIDDMLETADRLAAWVGGKAVQRESEMEQEKTPAQPLGVPFRQRDAD